MICYLFDRGCSCRSGRGSRSGSRSGCGHWRWRRDAHRRGDRCRRSWFHWTRRPLQALRPLGSGQASWPLLSTRSLFSLQFRSALFAPRTWYSLLAPLSNRTLCTLYTAREIGDRMIYCADWAGYADHGHGLREFEPELQDRFQRTEYVDANHSERDRKQDDIYVFVVLGGVVNRLGETTTRKNRHLSYRMPQSGAGRGGAVSLEGGTNWPFTPASVRRPNCLANGGSVSHGDSNRVALQRFEQMTREGLQRHGL